MMKVCFSGLAILPLFDSRHPVDFGGSDVRAHRFMTGLAQLPGFEVSGVVVDDGQRKTVRYGEITLHRHPRARTPRAGESARGLWLRAKDRYHRWSGNRDRGRSEAYDAAGADVYVAFGASELSAELGEYCRKRGKSLVLMLRSDADVSDKNIADSWERNAYGSRYGRCRDSLTLATRVVCQTRWQQSQLLRNFGIHGALIRNPIDCGAAPATEAATVTTAVPARRLVWIGRSDPAKRPELFIETARRLKNSDLRWVLVLNPFQAAFHRQLLRQVQDARPARVEVIERLAPRDIDPLLDGALALVNTSEVEGFPNTFLQAARLRVPVLSLEVDPDGFLSESGAGILVKEEMKAGVKEGPDALARAVERLAADPELWRRLGRNARDWVTFHHDEPARVQELAAVLREAGTAAAATASFTTATTRS